MARGADTFTLKIALLNLCRMLTDGDHEPHCVAAMVEHVAHESRKSLTLKIRQK